MICEKCKTQVEDGDKFCPKCGHDKLVPNKDKQAIASLILGITGFFTGGLSSIVGIIFGRIGLKSTKRYYAIAGLIISIITLILGITGIIVTTNNINSGGKSQTAVPTDPSNSMSRRPVSIYDGIGSITANTKDTAKRYTVTVTVNIGYYKDEATTTGAELNARKFELRDFLMYYFNNKHAEDLKDEERIKQEILEQLNTRYLDNAGAKIILFDRLDITEVFDDAQ